MRLMTTLTALSLIGAPALAAESSVADAALEDTLRTLASGEPMTIVLHTDALADVASRLLPLGHRLIDGKRTPVLAADGCMVQVHVEASTWRLADNGKCAGALPAPATPDAVPVGEAPVAPTVPAELPRAETPSPATEVKAAAPPVQATPPATDARATAAAPPTPTMDSPAKPFPREPGRFDGEGDAALVGFGVLYGAFAGGETGFLIGESLESSEAAHTYEGAIAGGLGGAAIGASLGTLLAARRDYERDEVALLYTSSAVGGFFGAELGRAIIPVGAPGDVERIHAATLAGSMAGVGIGILAADKAHAPKRQSGFVLGTAVGWQTGAGLAAMLRDPERDLNGDGIVERYAPRRRNAAIEIAGAGAFGALASAANHAGIESPTATTLGLSLGHGAWIGAWSPVLFADAPTEKAIAGGLRLGTGVGYASALGMAALGQPSPRAAALHTAGWAAGSALGAGIPLSLDKRFDGREVVGPMLAGGIGGQLLGAAVAPAYREFDADDAALLGVLEAWTGYQALGWSLWAGANQGNRISGRPIGYAMSAAGAGTLASLAVSPMLDVSPAGSMTLLSAGGWGTWGGAWGSQLAGLDADGVWLVTLASGNGTLLASGIAQGLGWEPKWRQLGLVNGTGIIGAAAGGLLGVVFLYDENDWNPLIASTLAGSAVGLGAGAVLAAHTKSEGVALLPELPGLRRAGLSAKVHAQPWMDDEGQAGAWVQIDITEIVD